METQLGWFQRRSKSLFCTHTTESEKVQLGPIFSLRVACQIVTSKKFEYVHCLPTFILSSISGLAAQSFKPSKVLSSQ